MNKFSSAFVLIALLAAGPAAAVVPEVIPVQGMLSDTAGNVVKGPQNLRFSLHPAETGTEELWFELREELVVDSGFFAAYLGEMTPLPWDLFDAQELWLEIRVAGEALSRVRLASVPFALEARTCEQVGDLAAGDVQPLLSDENACPAGNYLRGWNALTNAPICDVDKTSDGGDPLAQITCSAVTPVLKWTSTGWICAADNDTTLSDAAVVSIVSSNGFVQASSLADNSTGTSPVGWYDISGRPSPALNCSIVSNEATGTSEAQCPSGTVLMSGGCDTGTSGETETGISVSYPVSGPDNGKWKCRRQVGTNLRIRAYAICCTVTL